MWVPNSTLNTSTRVIFWRLYIWWRQNCLIYSWIGKHLTLSWRWTLSYRNHFIDLPFKSMDWFLYNRELNHKKDNSFHLLEQARGAIGALQSSMMMLLTKVFCNVNLKTLTILAKRLILVARLGPGRVSADGYHS